MFMRMIGINGAVLALAAMCVGATSAAPAPLPRLTAEEVVAGFRAQGVEIDAARLTLPELALRSPHPVLELMKIEPLPDGSARAMFRCEDRTSCIPFYVTARGLNRKLQPHSSAELTRRTAAPHGMVQEPPVIRRGSRAELEIVSPHMVIDVPVVALENGHPGESIRLASPDHKINYRGEVVAGGKLRAQL